MALASLYMSAANDAEIEPPILLILYPRWHPHGPRYHRLRKVPMAISKAPKAWPERFKNRHQGILAVVVVGREQPSKLAIVYAALMLVADKRNKKPTESKNAVNEKERSKASGLSRIKYVTDGKELEGTWCEVVRSSV